MGAVLAIGARDEGAVAGGDAAGTAANGAAAGMDASTAFVLWRLARVCFSTGAGGGSERAAGVGATGALSSSSVEGTLSSVGCGTAAALEGSG